MCVDFFNVFVQCELGMNVLVVNLYGYVGFFQMGEVVFIDVGYYCFDGIGVNDWWGGWMGKDGIMSFVDFKLNLQVQIVVVIVYEVKQWFYIQFKGLD